MRQSAPVPPTPKPPARSREVSRPARTAVRTPPPPCDRARVAHRPLSLLRAGPQKEEYEGRIKKVEEAAKKTQQVRRGLQLQSLWIIPTAAVS